MLLGIPQNFYITIMLFMLPIMLVLCSNMNNADVKILLLECSIRVFTIRGYYIGLFDSINAFQRILNVLLERIEPFNTVQCILY